MDCRAQLVIKYEHGDRMRLKSDAVARPPLRSVSLANRIVDEPRAELVRFTVRRSVGTLVHGTVCMNVRTDTFGGRAGN